MPAPQSLQVAEIWRGQTGRAPWKRLPGQVEAGLNVYLDIAQGGVTRQPTRFVADLDAYTGDSFDPDGHYYWATLRGFTIAIGVKGDLVTQAVHAWTIDGNPVEIIDVAGILDPSTGGDANFSYLPDGADAPLNIETASQYDTMIVTNRAKRARTTNAWSFRQSYNYIVHGHPNPLDENGDDLDNGGYDADSDKFDTLDEALDTRATTSDVNINGHVIFVQNDEDQDPRGFYVYYDGDAYPPYGTDTDAQSVILTTADEIFPDHSNWYRVPDGRGPTGTGRTSADRDNGHGGGRLRYDEWPHRLVILDDGTIAWAHGPYGQRLSGNNVTNPRPTVIRRPIRGVAFFNNRLFFLGEQTFIGSRTQEFFQFWVSNVNALVDADPTDQSLSFEDIGRGQRLREIGERLFIVMEAAQIEFGSGDQPLTSTNGRQRVVSRIKAKDIRIGYTADLVTMMDENLNIHQFTYLNVDQGTVHSGFLNIHDKIRWFNRDPLGVFQVTNTVIVPDITIPSALHHQQFQAQGQMIQSGWSFMTLGDDASIRLVFEWQDRHVIVTKDSTGYSLVSMVPEEVAPPDNLLFWPRLDRAEQVSGTYDESTNRTTFSHTGRPGDLVDTRLVLSWEDRVHETLKPSEVLTNGDVVFRGDLTTPTGEEDPWIGFVYDSELSLGQLWPGASVRIPIITDLYVFHHRSTDYDIEVVTPDGTVRRSTWQSSRAGVTPAGTPTLDTGYAEVPSVGDGRKVSLTLKKRGPGQAIWTALEYNLDVGGRN